jgi:ABC-type lipoprotein export system ATPase subunit
MPLLEVEDLHVAYGELEVVRGLSFAIESGEIITILGSNGAGKTTTLRCPAGLLPRARGRIEFSGGSIADMPAHEIADRGLALVPEGRQLFPEHTVRENLELGAYRYLRRGRRAEFAESLCHEVTMFAFRASMSQYLQVRRHVCVIREPIRGQHVLSAIPPIATKLLCRDELTRCATTGLMQRNKRRACRCSDLHHEPRPNRTFPALSRSWRRSSSSEPGARYGDLLGVRPGWRAGFTQ